MSLITALNKIGLFAFLVTAACDRKEPDAGCLLQVLLSSKEHIVQQYYIPTFFEKNFPSPRLLLKKIGKISSVVPSEIQSGSTNANKVALTFDACSTLLPSRFDSAVARILISTRTPATIFLGGKWVLDRPDDSKFLSSIPFFELGNHSYLHGHLTNVSDERLYHDLLWTQEIIYTVTGNIPALFRPPYLENDARVTRSAADLGLLTVCGDLASGDPDQNATKDRLIDQIRRDVHSGSIIIMHINEGGKHTAEALPDIISLLREKGYTLVTVSQLLKDR